MQCDTIVIGGGIIGMLTARYLSQAGQSVTLIDKSDTGKESSWAGGGIVSPLYPWRYKDSITALAQYGQQHYPALCQELLDDTGIDPEYRNSGLLMLSPEEEAEALQWAKQFDYRMESVTPDEMGRIEPAMKATDKSGLWMEKIGQVRNPRIVKALRADIEKRGINIITNTEITGFDLADNKVTAVITQDKKLSADQYAVCTGAWTSGLLKPLGLELSIAPVQGQMILFKASPDDIQRIVLEEDRYVIPRKDGRVVFGSTLENVGFDKHITNNAKEELHALAVERFPVLKDKPEEHHWAGLRPGTPDGVPVISQHPELENLFV
ncbi:MAG: glycine oxidase ThiO, partial [Gammaproteobacteria bacterium]